MRNTYVKLGANLASFGLGMGQIVAALVPGGALAKVLLSTAGGVATSTATMAISTQLDTIEKTARNENTWMNSIANLTGKGLVRNHISMSKYISFK